VIESLILYQQLTCARELLITDTDLHVIYHMTPVEQDTQINWEILLLVECRLEYHVDNIVWKAKGSKPNQAAATISEVDWNHMSMRVICISFL
jgi:hypothetical protein